MISSAFVISPATAAACTGTTGTSGSYTLMQFTAAQTGCTWSIPAGVSSVDVLIVGGGGGAGFGGLGGGGGAGAVLTSINPFSVTPGDVITLTVGGGGTAGFQGDATTSWYNGGNGGVSSVTIAASQYIATGGGGGGGNGAVGAVATGASGGSGGGGTSGYSGGGTNGNTYSGFNNYGNSGATGVGGAGGGGGASAAGSGKVGGDGRTLWGLSFAGGGGGWPSGAGATTYGGGSATAGQVTADHGNAGTNGTGGGGGGGSAGGSGLIVFRYLIDAIAPTLSSAAVPSSGNSAVLTFSESISATTAPTSAFTVTINGAVDTITSLSVSGTQITLNLQIQVTSALTVLVSYVDPTAGNDASAVQDLGLNDAASFSNQSVTNNSTTKTSVTFTLTLSGDGKSATYRTPSTVTLLGNAAGKARFMIAGKAIPGCQSALTTQVGNNYQAICNWRPSNRGTIIVKVVLTPSSALFTGATSANLSALVGSRAGNR